MNSVYHRSSDGTVNTKTGCWQKFRAEFSHGPFELVESNGQKVIDVQRTFAAKPFYFVLFLKLVVTGVSLDVLIRDLFLYETDKRYFYMSYLTHWGLVISEIYILMSLVNTIRRYPEQPVRGNPPDYFIRITWGLFSLASSSQAVITWLYWQMEYKPDDLLYYFGFMKHGGVLLLVLLEGLIVNRIPVRIHHLRYTISFLILYTIWTLIHGLLTDIGNPNEEDDAIYSVLNWKESPQQTTFIAVLAIFVLTPLLFFGIYLLSWPFRRYEGGSGEGLLAASLKNSKKSSRRSASV